MIRCESCPTSQSLKQVFNDNIIRFSFSSLSSIPWHQTHLHHFGQNPYHHQQPIHAKPPLKLDPSKLQRPGSPVKRAFLWQCGRIVMVQLSLLSGQKLRQGNWWCNCYGEKLSSLAVYNVKGAPYLAPPRGPSHPVQSVHL